MVCETFTVIAVDNSEVLVPHNPSCTAHLRVWVHILLASCSLVNVRMQTVSTCARAHRMRALYHRKNNGFPKCCDAMSKFSLYILLPLGQPYPLLATGREGGAPDVVSTVGLSIGRGSDMISCWVVSFQLLIVGWNSVDGVWSWKY